ncbi:hypothetical protein ABBQ38_006161 [Trebouxia sp. C0009 RCD-2024]
MSDLTVDEMTLFSRCVISQVLLQCRHAALLQQLVHLEAAAERPAGATLCMALHEHDGEGGSSLNAGCRDVLLEHASVKGNVSALASALHTEFVDCFDEVRSQSHSPTHHSTLSAEGRVGKLLLPAFGAGLTLGLACKVADNNVKGSNFSGRSKCESCFKSGQHKFAHNSTSRVRLPVVLPLLTFAQQGYHRPPLGLGHRGHTGKPPRSTNSQGRTPIDPSSSLAATKQGTQHTPLSPQPGSMGASSRPQGSRLRAASSPAGTSGLPTPTPTRHCLTDMSARERALEAAVQNSAGDSTQNDAADGRSCLLAEAFKHAAEKASADEHAAALTAAKAKAKGPKQPKTAEQVAARDARAAANRAQRQARASAAAEARGSQAQAAAEDTAKAQEQADVTALANKRAAAESGSGGCRQGSGCKPSC